MNFKYLNEMINFIEQNLTNEINYKDLAKIVGVSEYNLQRIFIFLTDMSISEYIRKRRLSKAFEDIKNTNFKIIDIALKYRYDSPISFSRAFKKYFNITPSECKNNNKKYKLMPIINFKNDSYYKELTYEIKYLDELKLYCYSVSANTHEDLLFKIRNLYSELKKTDLYNMMRKNGMYGISLYIGEKYRYCIGSKLKLKESSQLTINKNKYALFEVQSDIQKDIVSTYNYIYNNWLKSTNYMILDEPIIEYYQNNQCYIYVPIKDKQN